MERICRRLVFFILILGVFFVSQTASSEEKTEQQNQKKIEQKTDQKSSHKLEEITVTGKRPVEPVTSPYAVPESSALQTEVFTREDIEAIKPESVLDVLQFAPGIEVTYQGRKQFDFTNIRGQGDLGLVIDGVYIPKGTFTQRILASFSVDDIESITIVRDATALTLGPLTNFGSGNGSSNQGFIVIKTRRASKLEGGFIASYGSFHTEKEHVYQGAKLGDFDYRVAYTHDETLGKTNWYNASRNQTVYFRGGYTGKMINADMFYYNSNGMREMQRGEAYDGTLNTAKWKYDPQLSSLFGINLSKPWDARQTTTFSYGHNRTDFDNMSATFPKEWPVTSAKSHEWYQNYSLKHVVAFDNNTLRLGGQLLEQGTSQDLYSLYVHDEHRMLNNKLTVDGGIRADKKYYRESPVMTDTRMAQWSDAVYSYALGASYKLSQTFTLTGRYAYSENTLAGYQVDATKNGWLPPERRSRYEGGLLANIHPAFNPSLTVFYYDTKNQAVSTTVVCGTSKGKPVYCSYFIDPKTGEEFDYVTTADRVQTKGAEIGINGNFLNAFSYNLNYSYMTTNNAATNRGQPHVTASGRIGYKYKEFEANLNARYYGPWSSSTSDGQAATYDYGDFVNVGANINYHTKIFQRDTKITLYGQNLGDNHFTTRYRATVGAFKDPGRRFGIELSYSFF